MDHSGLAMQTASFNDPWDSGQVGWIYVSKLSYRASPITCWRGACSKAFAAWSTWIFACFRYFKANQADALTAAFKEYTQKDLARSARPSLLSQLHKFKELAQALGRDRVKNKEHEKGQ